MKIKLMLIIMFVLAGLVVPSWASFRTVGVYDPTDAPYFNDVEKSANGQWDRCTTDMRAYVLRLADIQPGGEYDIAAAFEAGMGGVIDGEGEFDAMEGTLIQAVFGMGEKTLDIGTNGTCGFGEEILLTPSKIPTSGSHRFNRTNNWSRLFQAGAITGGDPYEKVIVFGGTLIMDLGKLRIYYAIATFSDGSTVTAAANTITGDAFVGFVAPEGLYITGLEFDNEAAIIDDFFFITDTDFDAEIDAGADMLGHLGVDEPLDSTTARLGRVGENLTYEWSHPDAGVVFTNANDEDPTVTLPALGTYELKCALTGDMGTNASDTIIITVVDSSLEELNLLDPEGEPVEKASLRDALDGEGVPLSSTFLQLCENETYIYTWSSDPSGGVFTPNGDETASDPNVAFPYTAVDTVYVLTLDVTTVGDPVTVIMTDDVTITVTRPVLDAGGDQTVGLIFALEDIVLNPTIEQPLIGEDYNTYAWSCDPMTGVSFEDITAADPNISITLKNSYELTLVVTGSAPYNTVLTDTVNIYINEETVWAGPATGDWHVAANWTDPNSWPVAVPDDAKVVYLGGNVAAAKDVEVTVNINAAAEAYHIDVAADPNNPYTLNVNDGGSLTTVGDLNIAPDSAQTGIVNLLSGAPLTVGDDLTIGDDGIGTLSALASSVIDITGNLNVGDQGNGTFNMTGGTLTVGTWEDGFGPETEEPDVDEEKDISVSKDNDGTGTMTLDGVTVYVSDDINVASNDDDGDGSGEGTLTVIGSSDVYITDDLKVGQYGTGTVDITGGTLTIDEGNLYIASNSDADTGDGTVILTDVVVTVDDRLDIGKDGTGLLELYGETTITDISKDMDIGSGTGNGTLTMNGDSSISVDNEGKVFIGKGGTSTGTVNMNGNAYLFSDDQMRIGAGAGATGYLYMNDPGTELKMNAGEDLVIGYSGTGIVVTSGTILLSGSRAQIEIALNSGSYGSLTVDGPDALVDTSHDVRAAGTDGATAEIIVKNYGILRPGKDFELANSDSGTPDGTARADLTISSGGKIYVKAAAELAHHGRSDIYLTDPDSTLAFGVSSSGNNSGKNRNVELASNTESVGTIELRNDSEFYVHGRMYVACDGGTATIDIESSTFEMTDDLYLGGNEGDDGGGTVTMILNQGDIIIGKDFDVGGGLSTVSIVLIEGKIEVGDDFTFPSDADGVSATMVLGENVLTRDPNSATIEVNDEVDFTNADPATDYIDFLNGSLLDIEYEVFTAREIEELIASGVFRTTFSQASLNGVTPATGGPGVAEEYAVVYDVIGTDRFEVYLGIQLIPALCPAAGDITGDCIVDVEDIAALSAGWDDIYGMTELVDMATTWLDNEGLVYGSVPKPNPATFASAVANNNTTVTVTATTGFHPGGDTVEYFFECTQGGGTNSAWQTDPSHTDSGLTPGVTYGYTVKMRGDAELHVGDTSDPVYVISEIVPTPSTATFDSAPAATDNTTIAMTATTGSHPIYSVEYFFDETSLNTGGTDSIWQTSPTYIDDGLDTGVEYTYTVQMRDATEHREGLTSDPESAIAEFAPTPNPATFNVAPVGSGNTAITMTATIGTHPDSTVEYFFTCTAGGGDDSVWQTSPTYSDDGLDTGETYTYTVTMRDATEGYEGETSDEEDAIAEFAPTPNPATFDVAPASTNDTTIAMTATIGSHPDSTVEYFFDETSGNTGGTDSVWQTSPTYSDDGLDTGSLYTYTVTMRDATENYVGVTSDPASSVAGPETLVIWTSTTAPTSNVVTLDSQMLPGTHDETIKYIGDNSLDRGQTFTATATYWLDMITVRTRTEVQAGAREAGMGVELWNVDTDTLLSVSIGDRTPACLSVGDYITFDVIDTELTLDTKYAFVLRFNSAASNREMKIARVGGELGGAEMLEREFDAPRDPDVSLELPDDYGGYNDLVFYITKL